MADADPTETGMQEREGRQAPPIAEHNPALDVREPEYDNPGPARPNSIHVAASLISGRAMPPGLVGAARAILIAAGTAAIEATIQQLTNATPGQLIVYLPFVVAGLRAAEDALDELGKGS